MKKIAVGTSNPHKLEEINAMIKDIYPDSVEFVLVEGDFDPVENGTTFAQNSYIKAAEAASGISGRSDNPAPVESETPDAAGTVQGERHSGFSWRAVVIIAVVLAGGAAAAAAIHIKRKKEKSN